MTIRLICLDFDGTAVDYDGDATFFHPAVVTELNRLGDAGVEWCTNSGRSKEDQERILMASRERGLRYLPSAIISSEAYIFDRADDTMYVPREPWNSLAARQLADVHSRVQDALRGYVARWKTSFEADIHFGADHTVFCIPGDELRIDDFCSELSAAITVLPGLVVTRNGGWVVVLPENMGKGKILAQYMCMRGFQRDDVLAIGDHLNDISMLDGGAARWVACPANAKQRVIEAVRSAHGWVATEPGALGTAQVLRMHVGNILA